MAATLLRFRTAKFIHSSCFGADARPLVPRFMASYIDGDWQGTAN